MSIRFSFLRAFAIAVYCLTLLVDCKQHPGGTAGKADSLATTQAADIDTNDFATVFVTIADTSGDYYAIHNTMFRLQRELGWKIDTMERYYDTAKKEIVLTDTASDEIYRGEYFERRELSEFMSLEYCRVYRDASTNDNIALMCGLYDNKRQADSLLRLLQPHAAHAFVQQARLYMGCEH